MGREIKDAIRRAFVKAKRSEAVGFSSGVGDVFKITGVLKLQHANHFAWESTSQMFCLVMAPITCLEKLPSKVAYLPNES